MSENSSTAGLAPSAMESNPICARRDTLVIIDESMDVDAKGYAVVGKRVETRVARKTVASIVGAVCAITLAAFAQAQKQYGPGVTDTEIKIGQTMPYSGPASALSVAGRAQAAYINMVNDRGGVNGRKINLISLDDGYNPTKTV